MRIAALYDVHENLAALPAIMADVDRAAIETVIVGGDVATGPFPLETVELLTALGDRALVVRGNADREIVEAFDRHGSPGSDSEIVTTATPSTTCRAPRLRCGRPAFPTSRTTSRPAS